MVIVYEATNLVNGKRYIGVTKKALSKRVSDHFSRANSTTRRQTRFSNAIRKWGEESFDFVIRSEWKNYEDALAEEMRLISFENPQYNITVGGDSIKIPDRKSHGDWCKNISKALSGRKLSEISKQKIRIAIAATGRKAICVNDGMIGTIADLSVKYKIRKHSIRCVCDGEWGHTHGLVFSWDLSKIDPHAGEKAIQDMNYKLAAHQRSVGIKRRKKVIHIPSGEIFDSVTLASINHNLTQPGVSYLCRVKSGVFAFVEGGTT